MSSSPEFIRLRGVRQNNLKDFDLDLPLGKLIVVTGLSGSGKSSLVFDTLHAEGQRRYVETFSSYTRQFMDRLDRPKMEEIENVRPSIAIEQSNTVKTSRSTVGTMTELTDFFKVWFLRRAQLFDPDTGRLVEDDTPQSICRKISEAYEGKTIVLAFQVKRPEKMSWREILDSLRGQGFTRLWLDRDGGAFVRLEDVPDLLGTSDHTLHVVQDRVAIEAGSADRLQDGVSSALHFGQGELVVLSSEGKVLDRYCEGLRSPHTGRQFRRPTAGMFSFNSPIGACPKCRGFGRVIEIDYRLVIPDQTLSIEEGVIKAFTGQVYSESQKDLIRACRKHRIPTNIPWREMPEEHRRFVIDGDPHYNEGGHEYPKSWYGVRRFFEWLESTTYKMHVRVFLARFRSYVTCGDCGGSRLKPESLYWKWRGRPLPELFQMPIADLLALLRQDEPTSADGAPDLAHQSILTRLGFLEQVGLGYLTLDRASRTLSGGEVERVNLTSCLGAGLTDALFVLDEPSVGLHARDIDRLVGILRRLADQGNTVVVVEHDETIMRAADWIVEIGPRPGKEGGQLVYSGPASGILTNGDSITGAYLSGRQSIPMPSSRRPVDKDTPFLVFTGASRHNISNLNLRLPLNRFVAVSGVSGSGKSTLLNNVIYQGLLAQTGRSVEDPADIARIDAPQDLREVVLVDQSPISRTPRSNAALFSETWDPIRTLYASTDEARASGLTTSAFSFNSGDGRCPHCEGLGYERIEMQFMADIYSECPICEGRRFRPETLAIQWRGKSLDQVLAMTVSEALEFFKGKRKITSRLQALDDVGLGYLPLGQPLNTLSGGESQRLKLVRYLSQLNDSEHGGALLLLDEPTTGLHRHDVRRLLHVLQTLVEAGHSVVVVEHHQDVLKSADWLIEMGPDAGVNGGRLVFEGPPEKLASAMTVSAPFMWRAIHEPVAPVEISSNGAIAAEAPSSYNWVSDASPTSLSLSGARQHNLKNLSLEIPHRQLTVLTGVSGSGKSSLAFDIIFAEGQRRFMESMSPWARQYVEQLPRPEVDWLRGIPPTVAIEQRVTRGSGKSTVATVTEVGQYLRLLYARAGHQHSPHTGEALVALKPGALVERLKLILGKSRATQYICAPLIRGRKGHHEPLANWARSHGYKTLRIDGSFVDLENFRKLDRYREHDIECVVGQWDGKRLLDPSGAEAAPTDIVDTALRLGKGAFFLAGADAAVLSWLSTRKADPVTGEAFPDLDPKHFSWNSARGWCPVCHGYGMLFDWMRSDESLDQLPRSFNDGETCPGCNGERLNSIARAVYLHLEDGGRINLPGLLALTPERLLQTLDHLKLDERGRAIVDELKPEIDQRLRFMKEVGLDYLTLDRSATTLSGGESQRIRLAAQLGSNLSGVLYVLDEPSIGLHAQDSMRLIDSLKQLKEKGNTLLVVEHDDDIMREADNIIDLGPGAGAHGGEILAQGPVGVLTANPDSITGRYLKHGIEHPLRGKLRDLPATWTPRSRKTDWLVLQGGALRNLKNVDLCIPRGRLTVVCGISGAGKSTLIRDLMVPAVGEAIKKREHRLDGSSCVATHDHGRPTFKRLYNGNAFRSVIEVDQNPIGKTPRSTPATYIGAFDLIRQYFGALPEARMRGLNASTFSFNTKGGRCETCKGAGIVKLEMSFMPEAYVPCEACEGRRFGEELADIRWNGRNIADVLDMTFEEAAKFFSFHSRLSSLLDLMVQTGLGYLTLGQSSPTLSGGEAQRLKLVSELAKGLPTMKDRTRGERPENLYVLEEPTIGLHLSDCERLIDLIHRIVEQGHTVVVIEHHLDVIAEADYVVEVGPEGGERGGEILYQGPLSGLHDCPRSPTAPFLKRHADREQHNGSQEHGSCEHTQPQAASACSV